MNITPISLSNSVNNINHLYKNQNNGFFVRNSAKDAVSFSSRAKKAANTPEIYPNDRSRGKYCDPYYKASCPQGVDPKRVLKKLDLVTSDCIRKANNVRSSSTTLKEIVKTANNTINSGASYVQSGIVRYNKKDERTYLELKPIVKDDTAVRISATVNTGCIERIKAEKSVNGKPVSTALYTYNLLTGKLSRYEESNGEARKDAIIKSNIELKDEGIKFNKTIYQNDSSEDITGRIDYEDGKFSYAEYKNGPITVSKGVTDGIVYLLGTEEGHEDELGFLDCELLYDNNN